MIMKSAAYGWGRTECAVTMGEVCLDAMLVGVYECYMSNDEK